MRDRQFGDVIAATPVSPERRLESAALPPDARGHVFDVEVTVAQAGGPTVAVTTAVDIRASQGAV